MQFEERFLVLDKDLGVNEIDGDVESVLSEKLNKSERNQLLWIVSAIIKEDGYDAINSWEDIEYLAYKNGSKISELKGYQNVKGVLDFFWSGLGYCYVIYDDGICLPYDWNCGTLERDVVEQIYN